MVQQNRKGKASAVVKSLQCFKAQMMLIIADRNSVTHSSLVTSMIAPMQEGNLQYVQNNTGQQNFM